MGDPGIQFWSKWQRIGACGGSNAGAPWAELKSLFLLSLLQLPEDSSAELGMVDPGVEEVRLSPVVVRNLVAEAGGPRRRLDF